MLPWILAAFIIAPIAEVAVFYEMGIQWGLWPTIGTIFATALFGSILIRHQGIAVFRDVRGEMDAGRFPARQVFDGLCLLVAGILLLLPGFISDAGGFLLLLPIVRRLIFSCVANRLQLKAYGTNEARAHPNGHTIDGEFSDVTDRSSPLSKLDQPPPLSR